MGVHSCDRIIPKMRQEDRESKVSLGLHSQTYVANKQSKRQEDGAVNEREHLLPERQGPESHP